MKTERRHELQKNVLADRLGKTLNQVSPYTRWLSWAALAAGLVLLAVSVWYYMKTRNVSMAWEEYVDAQASPDRKSALQDLVVNRPNDAVGIWAQLAVADNDLRLGSRMVYENREEAEVNIKDAIQGYKEVLEASPRSPFLKQRAEYGCGQGHEVLGELGPARKHYEQVVELGKDTALGKQAEIQLKRLKNKDVRQFYDWFIAQRPAPSAPDNFGFPGLNNSPDTPDFKMPGLEGFDPGSSSDTGPDSTTPDSTTSESTIPGVTTPGAASPETTSSDAATPDGSSETDTSPQP